MSDHIDELKYNAVMFANSFIVYAGKGIVEGAHTLARIVTTVGGAIGLAMVLVYAHQDLTQYEKSCGPILGDNGKPHVEKVQRRITPKLLSSPQNSEAQTLFEELKK